MSRKFRGNLLNSNSKVRKDIKRRFMLNFGSIEFIFKIDNLSFETLEK